MLLDPDLMAVLFSVGVAGALALAALPGAVRRWRKLERGCRTCGRTILLGERTCDCDE